MLTKIKNRWMQFGFRQGLLELLIAFCMACLVWFYIHHRARSSLEQVSIPVQVQLAAHQQEDFALELSQRSITVSFSGPYSRIREVRRKLQRRLLKAVLTLNIPAEKYNESTFRETVRLDEECIAVPVGVKVEISEDHLPVTVHRLAERNLPIRLEWTGEARVSDIKIEPANVRVRGPKAVLDRASAIPTQPYAVQVSADGLWANEANLHDRIALVSELEGRPIQTNITTVQFHCRAVPKQKIYELVDVPVHFLCPKDCPYTMRFANEEAGKVKLKLIGPVTQQPPPVLAFVDLTAGNLARGRNLQPLRLQLPKDFQLVEPASVFVPFYLEEIGRAGENSHR
jgi:hypothetical protein